MFRSSKPLPDASAQIQDLEYLYASNANVSNFVSVKLSSNDDYHRWKTQMLCLMETHDMLGIVDVRFDGPRASSMKIMKRYDSLLRGWIFGSVGEAVLDNVVDLSSSKDVWDKLKSLYDPTMTFQQDSSQTKLEAKEETEDNDVSAEIVIETETEDKVAVSSEIEIKIETENKDAVSVKPKTKEGKCTTSVKTTGKTRSSTKERNKKLRKASMEGNWLEVETILKQHIGAEREAINSDGNTILHLAVGIGHNYFVQSLLRFIEEKEALEIRNLDGRTALHIAAIVGNKYAAKLLVEKHNELLRIIDNEGHEPLFKAYSNMQFDTFIYLLKASNDNGKTKQAISQGPHIKIGVNLLVNAISAKQYREWKKYISNKYYSLLIKYSLLCILIIVGTASDIAKKFPEFARENDEVLMAIARTFPSALSYWETLIYPPSMDDIGTDFEDRFTIGWIAWDISILLLLSGVLMYKYLDVPWSILFMILVVEFLLSLWLGVLFLLLLWLIHFLFCIFYLCLWKCLWKIVTRLVAPMKHIDKKMNEWEGAKKVLELVCNQIDESEFSGTHHPNYDRPILEAACQNAYQVIDEILYRSPEAIRSTDKNGYDIIQLAVIHRSEKIYNLIYQIGERKSRYRTIKDSSKNNILHLAGRLGTSNELNRRTGAALELQRELQWREELKKVVFPTYITEENIFKETPAMVFTREHKNLVKEGENWMKTTAESCSITAALIITIVFAAAITVPGGSNQETGIPLFSQDIAFTIFAISDAISLFTSSTSLLVFLSILTARFAEQDFLVSLPRQLIIGLCTLLLSTTAMMVAFGATLYLVFCRQRPWMLAPICGLAFLPIGFFVTQQFPLIVDLFRSTYVPIFGKQSTSHRHRFNPHDVQEFF